MIDKQHQGALVTLVERESMYTVMQAVAHRTAEAVGDAVTINEEIEHAMDKLNHRPKKLGYFTPYEVFIDTKTSLIVALGS